LTDRPKKSAKKILFKKSTEKNELKKTRTQPLPHPPTAGANRYRTLSTLKKIEQKKNQKKQPKRKRKKQPNPPLKGR
jgi:hypothetical protein